MGEVEGVNGGWIFPCQVTKQATECSDDKVTTIACLVSTWQPEPQLLRLLEAGGFNWCLYYCKKSKDVWFNKLQFMWRIYFISKVGERLMSSSVRYPVSMPKIIKARITGSLTKVSFTLSSTTQTLTLSSQFQHWSLWEVTNYGRLHSTVHKFFQWHHNIGLWWI